MKPSAEYLRLRDMYENARRQTIRYARKNAIARFLWEMVRCVDGFKIGAELVNPCPFEARDWSEVIEAFNFLGRLLLVRCEGSSQFCAELAHTVLPQILTELHTSRSRGIPMQVTSVALNFIRTYTGFKFQCKQWSFHGVPENHHSEEFACLAFEQIQHYISKHQGNEFVDDIVGPEVIELESSEDGNVDPEQMTDFKPENTTRKRSSSKLLEDTPGEEIFSIQHFKSARVDFRELWKSKKFSDVEFKCSNGVVKAHKCILSARSEMFRAMFDDEGGNSNLRKLDAEGATTATTDSLLKYVYTGFINLSDSENVVNLISLADKFQFYKLSAAGFDFLVRNMNLNNAGQLVKLVYDHQAPDAVKLKIQEYIISMRSELAGVPEYQDIVGKNPMALTTLMLGQFANE